MRLITLISVLLLGTIAARAHAVLDHTSPRVGAVVSQSPPEVRLWFTQRIEPRFSGFEITTADGAKIAGGGMVDPQHRDEMALRVPALKPGLYRVKWRVISVDSHRTEGEFSFEVRP